MDSEKLKAKLDAARITVNRLLELETGLRKHLLGDVKMALGDAIEYLQALDDLAAVSKPAPAPAFTPAEAPDTLGKVEPGELYPGEEAREDAWTDYSPAVTEPPSKPEPAPVPPMPAPKIEYRGHPAELADFPEAYAGWTKYEAVMAEQHWRNRNAAGRLIEPYEPVDFDIHSDCGLHCYRKRVYDIIIGLMRAGMSLTAARVYQDATDETYKQAQRAVAKLWNVRRATTK